jgi:hypothetical protein
MSNPTFQHRHYAALADMLADARDGLAEFAALVRPEADLDDSFKCFDTDNQQWLTVHGWLADSITDAE